MVSGCDPWGNGRLFPRGPLREPLSARDVTMNAMVESAIQSAELAEQTGLAHDRIILSAKVSGVQDLVDVYRKLAPRFER